MALPPRAGGLSFSLVRTARWIVLAGWLAGCGSESTDLDAGNIADAAVEHATDTAGNSSDVAPGDCPAQAGFTCIAACGSATQTPLLCDDGHWECESGVDSRTCP